MLVLLIIFLITIPVVTQTIQLSLPKETNLAVATKPENINISVNKDGDIFWNQTLVPDAEALFQRLSKIAVMTPQPEVHDPRRRARRATSRSAASSSSAPGLRSRRSSSSPNRPPKG